MNAVSVEHLQQLRHNLSGSLKIVFILVDTPLVPDSPIQLKVERYCENAMFEIHVIFPLYCDIEEDEDFSWAKLPA